MNPLLQGTSLIVRASFWLAGLVAVIGLPCQSVLRFDAADQRNQSIAAIGIMLALTAISACFLIFTNQTKQCSQNNIASKALFKLLDRNILIVPALAVGLVLPWMLLVPYVAFIALLEWLLRHRFRLSKQLQPMVLQNGFEGIFDEEESGEECDEATQRLVRRRTDENVDQLEGSFLVEFDEDQLTAVMHVPFCPAFDTVPNVDVFLLDEVPAKLIVSEPQIFGVRVEVKRDKSAPDRLRLVLLAAANN